MKKLLPILLLILLGGCVTYYYPTQGLDQDVYYQSDDPYYSDWSGSYASVSVYPWWSMDYFYLGYQPRNSPFSVGISYGFGYYSPWYSPYYSPWHYTSWYSPWYYRPYDYYAWHDPYWHHSYHDYHRNRHPGHGRYVHDGNNQPGRGYGGWASIDQRARESENTGGSSHQSREPVNPPPVSRRVSAASAGHSVDRGLEIRSRSDAKLQPSRLEPVPAVYQPIRATGSSSGRQPQVVSRQGSSGQIRSRADRKVQRPSTGPVRQPPDALALQPSTRLSPVTVTRSNGTAVRSRSSAKTGPAHTQPVRRSTSVPSTSGPSSSSQPAPRSSPSSSKRSSRPGSVSRSSSGTLKSDSEIRR